MKNLTGTVELKILITNSADGQNSSEAVQQQFESVQHPQHVHSTGNPIEGTFRHPLPPGIGRPRMPIPGIQPNPLIRNTLGNCLN